MYLVQALFISIALVGRHASHVEQIGITLEMLSLTVSLFRLFDKVEARDSKRISKVNSELLNNAFLRRRVLSLSRELTLGKQIVEMRYLQK